MIFISLWYLVSSMKIESGYPNSYAIRNAILNWPAYKRKHDSTVCGFLLIAILIQYKRVTIILQTWMDTILTVRA